jgi:hypothetical protein
LRALMGDEFEVDPAVLCAAAGQLDEHAGEVASHGATLGSQTAGSVGRGAIGEVVEAAVRRGIGIVARDVSRAVEKFYVDAAAVLRRAARETERTDGEAKSAFEALGRDDPGGTPPSEAEFSSPEIAGVWKVGIDTRAGRAYYTPEETEMHMFARALPPFSGEYTVDLHGAPDHVTVGDTSLDAGQLSELVRADRNWNNQPVRLFSCETGRGDQPIAQDLANRLGVEVTAPTELVWSNHRGDHFVAPARWRTIGGTKVLVPGPQPADGGWRTLGPERSDTGDRNGG